MKKINIILIFLVLFSCIKVKDKDNMINHVRIPQTADPNSEIVKMPLVSVSPAFFDFGEINQGESVSNDFTVSNKGEAPLLISDVKGSCGCTVAEFSDDPIAVGDSKVIKVTFNSAGKKGHQNKTVTLVTNAIPSAKILKITGNVLVPTK